MSRWIAITGAPTLRNLAEIWSIPDALVISKFSKIFSTDITTTKKKKKLSHLLRIFELYYPVFLIPNCLDMEVAVVMSLLTLRNTYKKIDNTILY